MKKKITVSVISDLTTDQRVIRICNTLYSMGFDVTVIARCFANSLPLDTYLFKATRIKCFYNKGVLQYAEFNIKLFFRLLFTKTDFFLANDLDTLIPNYIISKCLGKRLFYDTHEYFTGVPELRESHVKRRIWKFFENWIFPKLKTVYTVNDSVKNKYKLEYGNEIGVIRNVPVTTLVEKTEMPKTWQNKKVLLMQGAGINAGRGGIELLETMRFLPDKYLLVFIGSGNQWTEIEKKVKEWCLQDKVEMIAKLPPAQLKKYTPFSHLGFSLDSFTDINCLFNLPNKIFDYIHAQVPVIATAIPEVAAIIKQYDCGICLNNYEPENIAKAIEAITENEIEYQRLKQNCITAAKELCWEKEKEKLISIYQPFL